jgi:RNA polymerase sigma-70 factor, ECF subfamily
VTEGTGRVPLDYALLQNARHGDRAAFDRLQKRLEPDVRRFVRRLIGQSADVDEVVQRTFMALYVKAEHIESETHLRPFVYRVARHLCYDELRRQKRYDFVPVNHGSDYDENEWVPVDRRQAPDDATHWSMAYERVRRAIESLPEAQRQTLILHFEEDLTYAQTAEAMDVDLGTVKSRIHNARKRLRATVGPDMLRALGIQKE